MVDQSSSSSPHVKLTPAERQARNAVLQRLQATGAYDQLKHALYAGLVLDEDWRQTVLETAQKVTAEGVADLTLDRLVMEIVQSAGSVAVPESFRQETVEGIRKAASATNGRTALEECERLGHGLS